MKRCWSRIGWTGLAFGLCWWLLTAVLTIGIGGLWGAFAETPVVINAATFPAAGAPSGSSPYITPTVTAAGANNLVLKASPGYVYRVFASNLTSTAGFLVLLNATVAPADGAITPLDCRSLPSSGSVEINYSPGPAALYSTGIVAVLTSASTCFTKTTGTITGFIGGLVE